MSKVYFHYSAMNAGKTTLLLQIRHNYEESGMRTLCFKPAIDTRESAGEITSRIGLRAPCHMLGSDESIFQIVRGTQKDGKTVACVLIDEAQFLGVRQVGEVFDVCDTLGIPVLCFGLRSDFLGRAFPGSAELLAKADNLVELKTVCHCGRKATMNMRIDGRGMPVVSGEQILIGGNESYVSVCRKHFHEALGRTH